MSNFIPHNQIDVDIGRGLSLLDLGDEAIYGLETEITDLHQIIHERHHFSTADYITTKDYDEALDDANPITIAGMDFKASDILKTMDSTAYNTGFDEFVNSFHIYDLTAWHDLEDRLDDSYDIIQLISGMENGHYYHAINPDTGDSYAQGPLWEVLDYVLNDHQNKDDITGLELIIAPQQ